MAWFWAGCEAERPELPCRRLRTAFLMHGPCRVRYALETLGRVELAHVPFDHAPHELREHGVHAVRTTPAAFVDR